MLGTVGMALHHKLCHTLGGSFDLPHAETHAVLLPHTVAYTEVAAPDLLAPVAEMFGGSAGGGLYDFSASLGAPLALKDLGLAEADLDRAADLATQNPYWNPRPVEREAAARPAATGLGKAHDRNDAPAHQRETRPDPRRFVRRGSA